MIYKNDENKKIKKKDWYGKLFTSEIIYKQYFDFLLNKEMIKQSQKIFNALFLNKAIAFNFGAHGEINRDQIIMRN